MRSTHIQNVEDKRLFAAAVTMFGGIALVVLLLLGMLISSGCFTTADAYTKTQNPDGTFTESRVRIKSTGDKASELAAEGLFADGTVDALGAGVAKGGASQQSSGADNILSMIIPPLVQGLTGVAGQHYDYRQAQLPYRYDVAGAGVGAGTTVGDPSVCEVDEGTPGVGGAVGAVNGFNGVPGIDGTGVYGRPTCSRSRNYAATHGVELINIDNSAYRSEMWRALRERGFPANTSVQLPVLITEEGYVQQAK